jgi:glyoxylase-like metal-dependent hydrolase (beta-lactamase superfamily II)
MSKIKPITLALPFGMGSVNCYLIKNDANFILIDTGISRNRPHLDQELAEAGCQPGDLKLVLLTHGDFDHIGNAAYLRGKYGAQILMGRDDWGTIERADMFWNRKKSNALLRWLGPRLIGFGKADRCTPDIAAAEGDDLGEYGFQAKILSIPGHSKGSVGVLTSDGELFCGDLLENSTTPKQGPIVDDIHAMEDSITRLKGMGIRMVYPGHGKPFEMQLIEDIVIQT